MRDEAPTLRELIAQLLDAGKAYAHAELAYLRQLATARVTAAAIGIGLLVAALLFLQASLTVLVAALGLWLGRWLGTAGGLGVGAALGLLLAGLLAWLGVRRIATSGEIK